MRPGRALAQLLLIVSLTLLQGLQPLLHAHARPFDAGMTAPPAPGAGAVHLPDSFGFDAIDRCAGPLPATVTAQDESRRAPTGLQPPAVPIPQRRLARTGDTHVAPITARTTPVPDDPFDRVRPPRGPPSSS